MTREQSILLDGLKMISEIFWGPGPERCAQMLEPSYSQRLAALAKVYNGKLSETAEQLESVIKSFADGDSLYDHLEERYVRLFVSAKGGIVAPLYESCYQFEGAPLMGRAAGEMRERLEEKGLSVADSLKEPADHISIELEYLYFLLEKGWQQGDDALVDEASKFAADTMLPWVSGLEEKLEREEECGFYALVARILLEVLNIIKDLKRRR